VSEAKESSLVANLVGDLASRGVSNVVGGVKNAVLPWRWFGHGREGEGEADKKGGKGDAGGQQQQGGK
jgi:hypothetical protein